MKYVKTLCIALLLTVVNNTVGFCQNTDPFVDDEYPVYGKVLEAAYSFLVFSPAQEQSSPFVLRLDSGWRETLERTFPHAAQEIPFCGR